MSTKVLLAFLQTQRDPGPFFQHHHNDTTDTMMAGIRPPGHHKTSVPNRCKGKAVFLKLSLGSTLHSILGWKMDTGLTTADPPRNTSEVWTVRVAPLAHSIKKGLNRAQGSLEWNTDQLLFCLAANKVLQCYSAKLEQVAET